MRDIDQHQFQTQQAHDLAHERKNHKLVKLNRDKRQKGKNFK